MNRKKNREESFSREDKQLSAEEMNAVSGGTKVVPEDDSSWWRTLTDLFFKQKPRD